MRASLSRPMVPAMLMFRPLMRYADFRGRASKAEYWGFLGAQTVVCLICFGLALLSATKGGMSGALSTLAWLAVLGLVILALALPTYAVLARRLHDIGRSAVWMLLLVPGVFSQFSGFVTLGTLILHATGGGLTRDVIEQSLAADAAGSGLLALAAGACNLALLIMTVLPGQTGPNRFGPDPKDRHALAPDPHALDEDRWDALIAEAKRGDPDQPYKPVFDFGPGPSAPEPAPFPAQPQQWSNPAWDPGVAPSRPFGRRGA